MDSLTAYHFGISGMVDAMFFRLPRQEREKRQLKSWYNSRMRLLYHEGAGFPIVLFYERGEF